MIIRENDRFFILIRQHDHGLLSGEIAANWGNPDFAVPDHELVLTTSLHDLSWIETDNALRWNDEIDRPYDFTSLPFETRLPMYENGLDLTEQLNPYGGLLTSKHYCSFFNEGESEKTDLFLQREHRRQKRLRRVFFGKPVKIHLRHLQLWDNLSLYVCLNRPGATKQEEHPWFKDGIQAVTRKGQPVKIDLHWLNERTITIDPFPFAESWSTTFRYSKVRKSLGPKDPDSQKTFRQHIRFVSS